MNKIASTTNITQKKKKSEKKKKELTKIPTKEQTKAAGPKVNKK